MNETEDGTGHRVYSFRQKNKNIPRVPMLAIIVLHLISLIILSRV
jgi:hypothetical protein